jgi:hypothetical protein
MILTGLSRQESGRTGAVLPANGASILNINFYNRPLHVRMACATRKVLSEGPAHGSFRVSMLPLH